MAFENISSEDEDVQQKAPIAVGKRKAMTDKIQEKKPRLLFKSEERAWIIARMSSEEGNLLHVNSRDLTPVENIKRKVQWNTAYHEFMKQPFVDYDYSETQFRDFIRNTFKKCQKILDKYTAQLNNNEAVDVTAEEKAMLMVAAASNKAAALPVAEDSDGLAAGFFDLNTDVVVVGDANDADGHNDVIVTGVLQKSSRRSSTARAPISLSSSPEIISQKRPTSAPPAAMQAVPVATITLKDLQEATEQRRKKQYDRQAYHQKPFAAPLKTIANSEAEILKLRQAEHATQEAAHHAKIEYYKLKKRNAIELHQILMEGAHQELENKLLFKQVMKTKIAGMNDSGDRAPTHKEADQSQKKLRLTPENSDEGSDSADVFTQRK